MTCPRCGTWQTGAYCTGCGERLPAAPTRAVPTAPASAPPPAEQGPPAYGPPAYDAPPPYGSAPPYGTAPPYGSAPPTYDPPPPYASPPAGRSRLVPVVVGLAVALLLLAVGGGVLLLRGSSPADDSGTTTTAATGTSPAGSPATTVPPDATPSASPSVPAASFAELYSRTSDGVVRIETAACDGGGVGSGFLIAPDLVATVAHVVEGATSVVLRQGDEGTTGTVVGYDAQAELALVRARVPLHGHVFALGDDQPAVGTDVGAIGYPLAGDETLTRGTVSGLDRAITTDTAALRGLLQTDTALNPGNSGGPLLLADGTVVGLVEAKDVTGEGIGYAVPATDAAAQLRSWQRSPVPLPAAECDDGESSGPSDVGDVVTDRSGTDAGAGIAAAFATYAHGINTGDFASAYDVLSPASQARTGYDEFRSGTLESYLVDLDVLSTSGSGGRVSAEVRFTSLQPASAGVGGQTCSEWAMTYTMVEAGGGWLIDSARPHPGSPSPC